MGTIMPASPEGRTSNRKVSLPVVTKVIGDDDLPEPHAWAVVRTDSTVYAFVKHSAPAAAVARAQAVAERQAARA